MPVHCGSKPQSWWLTQEAENSSSHPQEGNRKHELDRSGWGYKPSKLTMVTNFLPKLHLVNFPKQCHQWERYSNAWDWEQGESIELTFWTHSFGVSFHHTPHNIVENHKKQPTGLKGGRFKDVQATQCVSWTEGFPRRERRTAVQVPFERKADSCG